MLVARLSRAEWFDVISVCEGDLPGFTSSNGFGGKARTVADLPDDYLRFTEKTNPDVLEGPEALLYSLLMLLLAQWRRR